MFATKILKEKKSKFNGSLRVVRTFGMGTYIQAGGLTQSGGIVETIWRQTLRQIKANRQEVKEVLILGLGGGTVAKLLRKKYPETKITGIDIDPTIVELGKKYLGLDQIKIDIKINDAQKELKSTKKKYDLIIVDSGISVFNRLYYGDKRPQAVKFGNKLNKIFSKVTWFYPEANVMFLCSN